MRTFRDLFDKGDFFFKVDLKSGYHHLDILESHQKYLGFSWIVDGIERFFVFTVLVFGLASALFIFTKVVRVLIKHWRGMAIQIFAFVDDFLGGAKSREQAAEASAQVKGDLECSGFTVCPEKTQWHPVQKGEHLGYFVGPAVRCDFIAGCQDAKTQRKNSVSAGYWCHSQEDCWCHWHCYFYGVGLGACGTAVWTRSLYHRVKLRQSWDRKIELTSESMHELHFWKSCFEEFNGQPIWPISPKCAVSSYSDASSWGWGGYVVQVGRSMSKCNFSEFEASKSSTWRELQGTFNVLSSLVELTQGQILKHCTDNKNIERVLSVGSRTPDLQELVIDIFRLCIQYNIQLVPEWILREENIVADEISKSIDVDD